MAETKNCPHCFEVLALLTVRCPKCDHLFKNRMLCGLCMGAYPLNLLVLEEGKGIRCRSCIEKEKQQQQDAQTLANLDKARQKKLNHEKNRILYLFLPFLGFFKLHQAARRAYKNYQPQRLLHLGMFLNLLWTIALVYLSGEYYFFKNQNTQYHRVIQRIHTLISAQNQLKTKTKSYGMIEKLVQEKVLEIPLEIGNRQVYFDEHSYRFSIYVASREIWQMKANPLSTSSVDFRFYADQTGKIRYAYNKEAEPTSPVFQENKSSFFQHLQEGSWLSKAIRSYTQ
jgi:hypothetical protein